MLHRIEVDVVDMAFEVDLVAYPMFPVSTLPAAALGPDGATPGSQFAGFKAA